MSSQRSYSLRTRVQTIPLASSLAIASKRRPARKSRQQAIQRVAEAEDRIAQSLAAEKTNSTQPGLAIPASAPSPPRTSQSVSSPVDRGDIDLVGEDSIPSPSEDQDPFNDESENEDTQPRPAKAQKLSHPEEEDSDMDVDDGDDAVIPTPSKSKKHVPGSLRSQVRAMSLRSASPPPHPALKRLTRSKPPKLPDPKHQRRSAAVLPRRHINKASAATKRQQKRLPGPSTDTNVSLDHPLLTRQPVVQVVHTRVSNDNDMNYQPGPSVRYRRSESSPPPESRPDSPPPPSSPPPPVSLIPALREKATVVVDIPWPQKTYYEDNRKFRQLAKPTLLHWAGAGSEPFEVHFRRAGEMSLADATEEIIFPQIMDREFFQHEQGVASVYLRFSSYISNDRSEKVKRARTSATIEFKEHHFNTQQSRDWAHKQLKSQDWIYSHPERTENNRGTFLSRLVLRVYSLHRDRTRHTVHDFGAQCGGLGICLAAIHYILATWAKPEYHEFVAKINKAKQEKAAKAGEIGNKRKRDDTETHVSVCRRHEFSFNSGTWSKWANYYASMADQLNPLQWSLINTRADAMSSNFATQVPDTTGEDDMPAIYFETDE